MARRFPSVVIEKVQPLIDGGEYPVKRVIGEDLAVAADIFKDGHDVVAAVLKWRVVGKRAWRETPMSFADNDRWRGVCTLYDQAIHEYTVEAWTDTFRSWQSEFVKKFEGGISDLRSEALEGSAIVESAAKRARDRADAARLREFSTQISGAASLEIYAIAQSPELEVLMATYPDRSDATQYVPVPRVVVDRRAALFGAWYEFFPRSAEGRGDPGSTFRDCLPRLDDANAMGFEVIYPLNFRCENWRELWAEIKSIVLFWAERGVRIFRVDNPHTKPVAFWEYLITGVRDKYPDTIFLSEAFTRPKMMKALAKAGFNQSYTYFTWRNSKRELIEYFTELTQTEMSEYFRPNLWPNTPDILPFVLQEGGRPAFMIRVLLAATLSPLYGIYSGYELCENQALPDREEYLDSEKYQFKERDWNAPGNIKDWIARLNRIRKQNRSLQLYTNLRFYPAENEAILFYSKMTPARDNIILVVVNLDPHRKQHSFVYVPIKQFGQMESDQYKVQDLLSDATYTWRGRRNYVELDPEVQPAHIFLVRR